MRPKTFFGDGTKSVEGKIDRGAGKKRERERDGKKRDSKECQGSQVSPFGKRPRDRKHRSKRASKLNQMNEGKAAVSS